MGAAAGPRKSVAGQVPPRSGQWWHAPGAAYQQPAAQARATVAEIADPPESRALVALGYPLWPLALISLFDRKQSRALRKHAYQALGFNVGMAALYSALWFFVKLPLLNIGAALMLAFILPTFIVLSVYYGIKAWHGEEVRVPIISDWLDDRMPA